MAFDILDLPDPSASNNSSELAPKKGRSWLLPGIVILVVVVLGTFLLVNRLHTAKKSPLVNQAASIRQAKVVIGANGFSPATIQVSTGSQVTWTSTDTAPHQVAADPYPKDDSIPSFDSTVILQNGDSFSHVFNKSGTYTYHDEKNPFNFHGTVVVR